MENVPIPIPPTVAKHATTRRALIASILGAISGAGVIGGTWLPLANLAGLGSVGSFDYSHSRAYAGVAVASIVVVGSVARCFRIVLVAAGILCGLLSSTAIDLYQALHDVMSTGDDALAQMAQQLVAHSSLQVGAYLLPLCGVACIVAGLLGTSPVLPTPQVQVA